MCELIYNENCKVAIFKPPVGDDYRQLVMDYMMKMADFEWTPKETFHIKWKNAGDYGVDLVYEKGKTYHGMTYANTKCSLDEFEQFFEDGKFVPNSEYYEEIIGNHCSSSMGLAYQQLLDFPYYGGIAPCPTRGTMLKYCGDLKYPKDFGKFDVSDLWNLHSKKTVMEAYASVDKGDVLYFFSKVRTGHLRMISQPAEVTRFENGEIDPDNSFIYTVEQTNTFDTQDTARGRNTTWLINRKRSFSTLYERFFCPITFTIFTSGEKPKDAFLTYTGINNAETVKNGINGDIISSFPLTYVRITVRDKDNKIVASSHRYDFQRTYKMDLVPMGEELKLNELSKGKYTLTIRAGIARGGVDFEKFEFEVK